MVLGGIALGVASHWDSQPKDQIATADSTAAEPQSGSSLTGTESGDDDLFAETATGAIAPPAELQAPSDDSVIWTQVVGAGDSLSKLLAKAGLDTDVSRDLTAAIGSEFDLRHLKPGHRLTLATSPDGVPRTATLEIAGGTRILARFGATPSVQRLAPDLDSVRRAGEAKIGSSIYAALEGAGIPTRFATDLELILAGTFDLRTALVGGEHIRLLWREHRFGDRVVGEPTIDFAQLDLADGRYEILWPDDESRQTRIFKDGLLVQTFDQPIRGARLSSAFGPRMHPIHGYVRMHSGVDFAAEQGAVVSATQSGTIAFMGERSGYGLLVELEHEGGLSTLYAHLSALNEDLHVGQGVVAGAEIGRAGSTGTSTAPHLHYEIHVDGRPVSPLADTRLHGPENGAPGAAESRLLVDGMQSELDRLLGSRG
ncbi:hypothetical protein P775_06970 [Puniceibacterium antarcticum]|uniref:M23ase beta-sheet core domain-containing protein n=1 Tax=Puniceibacterium antarcticum TaxID=1206336 RepID=A0A2G8RH77_9RHOB|nr:hypothetical protein P775_06970 [Puniceibacterium antarcticum]